MPTDFRDEPVEVDSQSFTELFEQTEYPLSLDTYQRGFVWNNEKIEQLVNDLAEYDSSSGNAPSYYMGSILLHRNHEDSKCYVIDGQQRLTALSILHYHLTQALPINFDFKFSSRSKHRIKNAQATLASREIGLPEDIFSRISFSVIWVERVDLAFSFFDTQNNRGVRLHATDLLKSYHLRAIKTDEKNLQTQAAKRWEGVQYTESLLADEKDLAPFLFSKLLWRARCWSGSDIKRANHDLLLEEFQDEAWQHETDMAIVPLYASRNNRLGSSLHIDSNGSSEIVGLRIPLENSADTLPFSLRQPIHEGINFFLYAEKYAALLKRLRNESTTDAEVKGFQHVLKSLMKKNSFYLREIYLLACFFYVDQFGTEHLFEFALQLEYEFGAIRLSKKQVRYETAQNFFKVGHHQSRNLLDVIAASFHPQQVLAYLIQNSNASKDYKQYEREVDKESTSSGVQWRYYQAMRTYFEKGNDPKQSVANKSQWIKEKLGQGIS